MDFFNHLDNAFFLAQFTYGMLLDVKLSYAPPAITISLVRVWVSLVLVVLPVGFLFVLLAVPVFG